MSSIEAPGLTAGFNAAAMGVAPQTTPGAPDALPAALLDMMTKRDRVLAQFWDSSLVFDHSDKISDELVILCVTSFRNFLVDIKSLVALTPDTTSYLHSMVWVIPDTRNIPANPTKGRFLLKDTHTVCHTATLIFRDKGHADRVPTITCHVL